MVTISESKKPKFRLFASVQLRYACTFVVLTTAVLLFLNIYCATMSEKLFYQSKQTSLFEKSLMVASEITAADNMTPSGIAGAVLRSGSMRQDRVVVTDLQGTILYDSTLDEPAADPVLPEEIPQALNGERTFTFHFSNGIITAAAAVPIQTNDTIIGSVYMLEIDKNDGLLLQQLTDNILVITLVLQVGLIFFAIFYVSRYNRRLQKIMESMRIIQEGDFSHKLQLPGHDELAFLADEFNYLTDRLQISENKRRQFVSDASHELKTPLASIKLLSDSILQYDMDMQTIREFAGDIGNEADRLNRMTMKLLALTKNEANSTATEAEIIYMTPTIERVVKMLDGIAKTNKITISLDLQQDTPVLLQEDDLYQITFNLVENGIKYNVPGGTLSISLHRQEEMTVMRISDTGVGIPPDALSHVFERFYRVDKARSRQSGGSGLGLAIVRAMVERNNGEIHLQSTVGKGTIFTVAFPCFEIDDILSNDELFLEEEEAL